MASVRGVCAVGRSTLPNMSALAPHAMQTRVVAMELRLVDMNRDVMGNIVLQAALEARSAQNPILSMCKWMESFCTAVASNNRTKCHDDLYRLALAVFGFVPTIMPSRSGFQDWKSLFHKLCDAFTSVIRLDQSSWKRKRTSIWSSVESWLLHRDGIKPTDEYMIGQFFKVDMSKRDMDLLLDGVLEHAHPTNPSSGRRWPDDEVDWLRGVWDRRFNQKYLRHPSSHEVYTDPWMAVMTLLVLRGAQPFQTKHYEDMDNDMYLALTLTFASTSELVQSISKEDATDRIKEALDRGGDPNYAGRFFHRVDNFQIIQRHVRTVYGEDRSGWRQTLLTIALISENGPVVKLLVDAGAHLTPNANNRNQCFRALSYFLTPAAATDQETTEKLIAMVSASEQNTPEVSTTHLTETNKTVSEWLTTLDMEDLHSLKMIVPLWITNPIRLLASPT